MKQFSHRLVERPRWEQFDSFTAQFVIVLMMKMMMSIMEMVTLKMMITTVMILAAAMIGKVGGSGDCFFPSLEVHKMPSDVCKDDEDGI